MVRSCAAEKKERLSSCADCVGTAEAESRDEGQCCAPRGCCSAAKRHRDALPLAGSAETPPPPTVTPHPTLHGPMICPCTAASAMLPVHRCPCSGHSSRHTARQLSCLRLDNQNVTRSVQLRGSLFAVPQTLRNGPPASPRSSGDDVPKSDATSDTTLSSTSACTTAVSALVLRCTGA